MAQSINPAGSGTPAEWETDRARYLLGALVGALVSIGLVFTVLGLAGLISPVTAVVVALCFMALTLGHEFIPSIPVPYGRQQVPDWWRTMLPPRTVPMAYGVSLGFGFATPFTSATHGAALTAAALVGGPLLLAGTAFGYAIGRTVVLSVGVGAESHEQILSRIDRVELVSRPRRIARLVADTQAVSLMVLVVVGYASARGWWP